ETKSLRELMDALLEEGKDLRHLVEQHVTVVSPIRRFPPEVLAEIFWWTRLPPHDYSRSAVTPDLRTQVPWNISRVCTRWRAISVGLPTLW
ncbi:hypothetical protein C8R44DRAFT_566678, partial [Mycena epipterygia]